MKRTIGTVLAAVSGVVMMAGCASTGGAGASGDGWVWNFDKSSAYDMISPNAQDNVKIGQDEDHGKFLSFDFTGSTANTRGAYYNFKGGAPADPVYVVEFDASLKAGNNQDSAFAIYSTDYSLRDTNGGLDKGWIINMTSSPKGPWTINNTKTAAIPAAKWCHFKLIVDRNQKLVSTVIMDGDTELTEKAVTAYNGNGAVKGVYMKAGRYQAVMSIDNLNIRAAKEGEGLGELGEEVLYSAKFEGAPAPIVKVSDTPTDYVFDFKAYGDRMGDMTEKAEIKWTFGGIDTTDPAVTLKQEGSKATITVTKGEKSHVAVITATATIGDKTVSASAPFVILNAAAVPGQLIPAAGYPVNMSDYSDEMVGYQATAKGLKDRDPVLNNWSIYGSNGNRALTLVKDDDGIKSLQFDSNRGGGSTLGVYQWADQKKKFVVEATVKYDNAVEFGIWGVNTPNNTDSVKYATIYASGGMMMAGSAAIMNVNPKVFYKYVMTVDPAAKKYDVEVFDMSGKSVGKAEGADLGASGGRYFCITGGFPTNVASLKAYTVETAE